LDQVWKISTDLTHKRWNLSERFWSR